MEYKKNYIKFYIYIYIYHIVANYPFEFAINI